MAGVLLPACSLFFSSLLCIIYFIKKRINLFENSLYSIMVVCSCIDSFIVTILQGMVANGLSDIEIKLIPLFNKVDFSLLIVYTNALFIYTVIISHPKIKNNIKKLLLPCIITDALVCLFMFTTKVEIISNNGNFSVDGMAVNLTYILCGLYIISSLIMAFFNIRKNDKRYIPMFVTSGLIIILLILFKINPYLIIVSITLTYVNFIMFHTIENPDIQMIEELYKANELAEKYNKDKSIFLFNMTQQVRYPLNVIEQRVEQISLNNNINEIKEINADIKKSTQSISNVINGVMDITTIDTKKIKIVDEKYSINKILKELTIRFTKETKEKNLELRTNFDSGLPDNLSGDSLRLKQIMIGILSNAVKFTHNGFIEFNVNSIISFDVCRLIITIKDSGIGMKTEEITKLFKTKEDVNYDAFEEKEISLDAAQKMVSLIGGTITVQSEKNKGSEFTIIIDQKIATDDMTEKVKEYSQAFNKKSILIVNDNNDELEIWKKNMASLGLVIYAKNGEECLNRIRNEEKFDLIVIKDEMEKLNGIDTLSKLKQVISFENNAILLTKEKDPIKIAYFKNLGFKEIISSDLPILDIKEIIKALLN